jgi:hypothetical protein
MHTLSKLTVLALAALIASASLAPASDIYGPFGTVVIKDPLAGIPQGPAKPQIPIIGKNGGPLVPLGPAKPSKPYIPIVGSNGDPIVPIGGFPKTPADRVQTELLFDCAVPGVEFAATNDLLIKNLGSSDLPAGLKLKFRVRSTGDHGAFLLPNSVGAGKQLLIADMLHGAIAGAPCDAQAI